MRKIYFLFLPVFLLLLSFGKKNEEHFCGANFFDEDIDLSAMKAEINAKRDYPKDYFRSPVKATIRLSGTFGELRPNHFHSGLDIKPVKSGSSGQPIYCVADGVIERIKVSPTGYGNVLYIRHTNGYKSVYAHLQSFDEKVAAYVKKAQYNRESFYVDLYPGAELFPFKKGDQIGKMGNSGGSQGPHLHFEIRTSGDVPCNPLLFGIDFEDTRKPKMHQLKIYHLNPEGETLTTEKHNLSRKEGEYGLKNDTLTVGAWRIGMSLKVYDHHNAVTNWNGIYSLKMYRNDSLAHEFEMDQFSFGETRYMNAHLDYEEQVTKKSYFNRTYYLPGNRLSIYGKDLNDGIIKLYKDRPTKIEFIAADANGNQAFLKFWVKRGEVKSSNRNGFSYVLEHKDENIVNTGSLVAKFKKKTFYENCYLNYSVSADNSKGYYSDVHHVGEFTTPLHKYYDISLVATKPIPAELKSKAFVAYCDKNNNIKNCGGKWNGDLLSAKTRSFGDYSIMLDTEAPTIRPKSFKKNMSTWNNMTFKIGDNFDTSGKARGLRYRATVDGKWILMELDSKKDLLIHRFDEKIGKGEHQLRIEVRDDRDNLGVYEATFVR